MRSKAGMPFLASEICDTLVEQIGKPEGLRAWRALINGEKDMKLTLQSTTNVGLTFLSGKPKQAMCAG